MAGFRTRSRSLSTALLLMACIGLVVPAAFIAIVLIGAREQQAMAQHQHQEMAGRLNVLAASLPELVWNLDTTSARPLVEAVMASDEVVRVAVTDVGQSAYFLEIDMPQRRHGASRTDSRELIRRGVVVGRVSIEADLSAFTAALQKQRLIYGLTVGVQVLMSLALILLMLNSRVMRPLRGLMSFADDLAEGRFDTRLGKPYDDEIGRLGERLERTRDKLQELFGEQAALLETVSAREADVRRLSDFYAALTRTNQAIARERDMSALCHEICRICVDTGHVQLAAISLLEGEAAGSHTFAGEPAEYLNILPSWEIRPTTARAIRTGESAIVNDLASQFPTTKATAHALKHGIHSVAAFPLRRAGRVVGALTLYGSAVGYFDAAVVELFAEMADDLSGALDRVDADRQRVQALQQAEAGLERFSRLFDSAPISISIVSQADGRVIDVNQAFSEHWGYARDEAIGHTITELGVGLLPADREKYLEILARDHRVSNFFGQVRTRAGKVRDVLINLELIEYAGQACLLTTAVDVTDLREAAVAREALAAATASNRAKTEFMSRMSHELRTPLNAVLGFAQLLERQAGSRLLPDEQAQLQHIYRAGRHLLTLINDILDVARIEGGTFGITLGATRLAPLLDDAVQMSNAIAKESGIVLSIAYRHAPMTTVLADPDRLRQVTINLLSNAIKYNRPGGSVHVAVGISGDDVSIDVVDTGHGMTREQLDHLYEPFNRLGRERGGIDGTGIGLALTRQLVLLMGGELDIISEVGRGTRARVTLQAADPTATVPMPFDDAPTVAAREQLRGTVLYIEDNPVNYLLVEQMLARINGLTVIHAEDGVSGVALARQTLPGLVLLDMQLPDIDGIEVLRRLRADPATRGLCVVALSASAMPEEVERAKQHGALDYWTKPLDMPRFLADVTRLISAAPVSS